MQLEPGPQVRILGAARDLLECVVPQRADAAEAHQAVREPPDFVAGPVVFLDNSGALVLDLRRTVRIAERIRLREDRGAPDAGGVEQRDQVGRCDWFDSRRRCHDWAVEVLVVVGNRACLVLYRSDRGGAEAGNENRSAEQLLRWFQEYAALGRLYPPPLTAMPSEDRATRGSTTICIRRRTRIRRR